jgi:hypothetical protein
VNIQIGEDYRIVNDSHNLILLRKRVSDPNHHFSKGIPKVSWEVEGYFSKFEHIVDRIVEKEIRTSNVKTLEELTKKVEETKELLVTKINQVTEYEEEQEE